MCIIFINMINIIMIVITNLIDLQLFAKIFVRFIIVMMIVNYFINYRIIFYYSSVLRYF